MWKRVQERQSVQAVDVGGFRPSILCLAFAVAGPRFKENVTQTHTSAGGGGVTWSVQCHQFLVAVLWLAAMLPSQRLQLSELCDATRDALSHAPGFKGQVKLLCCAVTETLSAGR